MFNLFLGYITENQKIRFPTPNTKSHSDDFKFGELEKDLQKNVYIVGQKI